MRYRPTSNSKFVIMLLLIVVLIVLRIMISQVGQTAVDRVKEADERISEQEKKAGVQEAASPIPRETTTPVKPAPEADTPVEPPVAPSGTNAPVTPPTTPSPEVR